MKVPPHVVGLYLKTVRKYNKVVSKLRRETVSAYQRQTFLQKLRRLLKTLRALEAQLKIGAATGTVVLILNSSPARAQETPSGLGPFVKQDRINNPLREPIFNGEEPALAVIDYDKDGDFDVVLGEYDYWYGGSLRYFENQSVQGSPLYLEKFGEENPFDGIRASTAAVAPAFADIDGDNDLDLFLGQNGWSSYYGSSMRGIEYYRNDDGAYTSQAGPWDETSKEGNPLDGITLGDYVKPVFVDFDKDGDQDVIVGSYLWTGYPDYLRQHIHYYVNNGSGTFSSSPITINQNIYPYSSIAPAVSDMDGDGDYDILIGAYNYGELIYLKQVSPGNFDVEWNDWDPETKTGNPFGNFDVGSNASPVFVDFNRDGMLDVFVADESSFYDYKYSDRIINYYENTGNGVFVEKDEFENPFDGVYVKENASPFFADLDGDSDLDVLIGNHEYDYYYDYPTSYYIYSSLAQYNREAEGFQKVPDELTAFKDLEVDGYFAPQLADVDGDGDRDLISGNDYGNIMFFRYDNGVYTEETELSPFAGINLPYGSFAKLVDIDQDNDLDLFVSDYSGGIHYYKNTGSAQAPVYTELFDLENPLDLPDLNLWRTAFMNFTDLDHDGDVDVFLNGPDPNNVEALIPTYVENTGTPDGPLFGPETEYPFGNTGEDAQIFTVDYDGDGDLDAFVGNEDGSVSYFQNQNVEVTTTLSGSVVEYESGADPVVIDPTLTLTDQDNEYIVQATVTIENYQFGEMLGFTDTETISGYFDVSTGVLTFRGKGNLENYQALLRSVTFKFTNEAGRRVPSKKTIIGKTITFAVFDQDFTNPRTESKSLEVFVNDPPAVGTRTINITSGASTTADLKELVSDPNGSADLDLSSLKVVAGPASGAITAIDANGILTIDYNNLTYLGTETLTIEVCDLGGACAQNSLTVVVTNTPPVIEPEPVSTPAGTAKSVNLMAITSDVDGNLNPDAFTIVSQPLSGALASIQVVSPTVVNLLLNYENITFHGTDELTVKACDLAGACAESVLQVEVDVDDAPGIVVYNAVAPNSTGDNKFMRITGLPSTHKVTVFNRWGDKVFDTENYANSTFKGENNSGKSLPSGTYFYIIEVPGEKMVTGYLTLKQ